jgi:hypothetical protein
MSSRTSRRIAALLSAIALSVSGVAISASASGNAVGYGSCCTVKR